VDCALRGELIINALQEPGQVRQVVRVYAADDLKLRMQVSQLCHPQAGFNEVCHVMGANRCEAKQQLGHILPDRQRDRQARVQPQLVAELAEPDPKLVSTGHDLQEIR
jgi:hypothetical protein